MDSKDAGRKKDSPGKAKSTTSTSDESQPVVVAAASTPSATKGAAKAPDTVVTKRLADATTIEAAAPEVTAIEQLAGRSKLPRFTMIVLSVAGVALSLGLMREFAGVIAPVFLGLNLMITVQPLVGILKRRGLPAWAASIVSMLLVTLLLVALALGVVWAIASLIQELPQYADRMQGTWDSILDGLNRLGFSQDALLNSIKGIDPKSVIPLVTSLLGSLQGFATLFIVMLTAVVFLAMDSPSAQSRMELARATHPAFVNALSDFSAGIRRYWIISSIFGAICSALNLAGLLAMGVPLALVWAMLSFITNYIPNIGFVIGLIPPTILALLDKGPKYALYVIILYSVVNVVIQTLIQPRFAGDAVGLTPTMSFLSLIVWTVVLGGMGALLALPMSLFMKAMMVDADPKARWVNAIISSRPADAVEVDPPVGATSQ